MHTCNTVRNNLGLTKRVSARSRAGNKIVQVNTKSWGPRYTSHLLLGLVLSIECTDSDRMHHLGKTAHVCPLRAKWDKHALYKFQYSQNFCPKWFHIPKFVNQMELHRFNTFTGNQSQAILRHLTSAKFLVHQERDKRTLYFRKRYRQAVESINVPSSRHHYCQAVENSVTKLWRRLLSNYGELWNVFVKNIQTLPPSCGKDYRPQALESVCVEPSLSSCRRHTR